MNPKYFLPLEFDKIRACVAGHTAFSTSEELALNLMPSSDTFAIQLWQQETTEARTLLDQQPSLGIGGARDIRLHTRAARVGALLNPRDILEIQSTLVSARNLRRNLIRFTEPYPRLATIASNLDDLPALSQAITRVLNERGEVLDEASSELARIRHTLNGLRGRMTEKLQQILSTSEFARYLQDPIITQRDGRYVIPVRAEARGRIKGIVHDSSASGVTLFIEPLAVVELGNRVRELVIEETREVERILRELTTQVATHADKLDHTLETLAQLDLAFAKAKYSAEYKGIAPKVSADKKSTVLQLLNARHPSLDPNHVVPNSVELGRTFSILIITGPNTGGKTVTLKTVGLLALMAQSGLHIPADTGSQLPVYDNIYADIGDEQSIEQNLSTFSSHMTNIIEILREANTRSLVLLDELGAGTDPIEGAALARTIIENLRQRKISTLVATHYAELKAFAHTTPDVENASVEFNIETLAPTYRLTIGLPGRSNAFAIAQRLGLDAKLIEQARANLTQSNVEFEKMLAEIKYAKEETARALSRAEAARDSSERTEARTRQRLAEIDKSRTEILQHARTEAHAELDAVRAELNRLRREWQHATPTRDLTARIEKDLSTVEELIQPIIEPKTLSQAKETFTIGDQVYVSSLDQVGQVTAQDENGIDVQIGAFRARLDSAQVQLRNKASSIDTEDDLRGTVFLPADESPGLEVHLRGMRADDALDKLDRFLDRAYRAGLPYVRIVHGKGTGTLRRLVREQLGANPLIASYQTAELNEGGEGVTVAQLVNR